MPDVHYQRIILTHWNAGVFHSALASYLLPELIIYSLLYDEVLIREEDLLTNRAIHQLLSERNNFAVFSEMLTSGLVKLLRLPLNYYPSGRRFDPVRLPFSARAEEHQLRRSYKGKPWKPSQEDWQLFRQIDELIAKYPSGSRYHIPFGPGNTFADQLGEILGNLQSYRIAAHPVFRYIDDGTAAQFLKFCKDPTEWLRFLHDHGIKNPIIGPDAGFYRSAAYQCSNLLPTPRAIRRLAESVYAATYCDRESSDGRYGGSELVELPYRYGSDSERIAANEDAVRVEVVATEASAAITLRPGIAGVLTRTRESLEFQSVRLAIEALGKNIESPLLAEGRFSNAWRDLCAVYAENSAKYMEHDRKADHYVMHFAVFLYVLARVMGIFLLPDSLPTLDFPVAEDAAAIAAIEKLGPKLLRSFRASMKIPSTRERIEKSASIRCSTVPLSVSKVGSSDKA
jgi:hypothetical protein